MFDIGWSELLLTAVVALVVIGPKELPGTLYQLGKWLRRARLMAREFQSHFDELMHEAEIEELRREARKAREIRVDRVLGDAVDPDRSMRAAFDVDTAGAAGFHGSPPEEDDIHAAAADPVSDHQASPASKPDPNPEKAA